MRLLKHITLGVLVTMGVFFAIIYTSCTKDACKGVTCLNDVKCSGGICNCPAGITGFNCETVYRKLYEHEYKGTATYSIVGEYPENVLQFTVPGDSTYTNMSLHWKNPGYPNIPLDIKLTNSSENGSNFEIVTEKIDTVVYSGTGSVNSTTASMTLIKTHPNSPKIIVHFNDFNRVK